MNFSVQASCEQGQLSMRPATQQVAQPVSSGLPSKRGSKQPTTAMQAAAISTRRFILVFDP
jgi:hypothetical protein